MLRFSGEELDVQEKFLLEILWYWSPCDLLTNIRVVLHEKPVYNMMKVTITASGRTTFVFLPSCDESDSQCHFLNFLKSEVLL